jgi:prepilin-type N-terminal cleavage/methylation domain-containing protein
MRYRKSSAAGFTLLEVVAGLTLLGVLAAATLVSLANYRKSLANSQAKQAALTAADDLLFGWFSAAGRVPAPAEGPVPNDARFVWRTALIGRETVLGETVDKVRLELFLRSDQSSASTAIPLASVEVIQKPSPGF